MVGYLVGGRPLFFGVVLSKTGQAVRWPYNKINFIVTNAVFIELKIAVLGLPNSYKTSCIITEII